MNARKLISAGAGLFLATGAAMFLSGAGGLANAQTPPALTTTTVTTTAPVASGTDVGSNVQVGSQQTGGPEDAGAAAKPETPEQPGTAIETKTPEGAAAADTDNVQQGLQQQGQHGGTAGGLDNEIKGAGA